MFCPQGKEKDNRRFLWEMMGQERGNKTVKQCKNPSNENATPGESAFQKQR
jgi:hypothetical protein